MITNTSFSFSGVYLYAMWAMLFLTMYGALVSLQRGNEFTFIVTKRINSEKNKHTYLSSLSVSRLFTDKNIVTHLVDMAILWGIIFLFLSVYLNKTVFGQTGSIVYTQTPFSVTLSSILIILNVVSLLTSKKTISTVVINVEIASLWVLSTIGGILVLCSTDNISLYLSLELQSFCFVVLCLIKSDSPYCIEAAMKYFLLSALASLFVLLGSVYIYSVVGTTNLLVTTELLSHSGILKNNIFFLIGVWMVTIGLLWKLASAPMHFWAADVYQGSPVPVSLAISTSPKLALFGFWLFALQPIINDTLGGTLVFFSAVSMVIGAICALGQIHIKRLIAYSSINHTGLLIIPICGGVSFFFSSSILLVHLMFYFITSILSWSLVMWPLERQEVTH